VVSLAGLNESAASFSDAYIIPSPPEPGRGSEPRLGEGSLLARRGCSSAHPA